MNIDRNALLKGLGKIFCVFLIAFALSKLINRNSMTLSELAAQNPNHASHRETSDNTADDKAADGDNAAADNQAGGDNAAADNQAGGNNTAADNQAGGNNTAADNQADGTDNAAAGGNTNTIPEGTSEATGDSASDTIPEAESSLIGASLNGTLMMEERISYQEGFYFEPLSDNLRRFITGVSYPESEENMAISYSDLRYVHVKHYDFDGNPAEGELICHEQIAQDLVEIFHELYLNEYQIEKIRLIDEYDGDDLASMEDNNTSCFNYRIVEGSDKLSKHAYGLALDINPLYNPYITYETDGSTYISPAAAKPYVDRSGSFPYKIDDNDLCYKLFVSHGFIWGGNWNSLKDYQHFQRNLE